MDSFKGDFSKDEGSNLQSVILSNQLMTSLSLKDLTVLSYQIDPYRQDTVAHHRDGAWFADQLERHNLLHRRLHLRGIHYVLLGSTIKPNGQTCANTFEDWQWLGVHALKSARWLGLISAMLED